MRVDDAPQEQLYAAVAREILPRLEALAQCRSTTMDVVRLVSFAMNWPGAADDPQELAALVHVGYEYNGWRIPATATK
jgi:hypothetical protein